MCHIVVKPRGVEIMPKEHIFNASYKNDDGFGIAYWKSGNDRVVIKKDFKDAIELWRFIEDNITVDDSLIVHLRFATSGITDSGNAHPFPITRNKTHLRNTNIKYPLVVAHNGVFSQFSYTNSRLSDTQHYIRNVLAPVKSKLFDSATVQNQIEKHLGYNKLAFMNDTGAIMCLGKFIVDTGRFYSNSDYESSYQYNYLSQRDSDWSEKYSSSKGYWLNGEFIEYESDWSKVEQCSYCNTFVDDVHRFQSDDFGDLQLCNTCHAKAVNLLILDDCTGI